MTVYGPDGGFVNIGVGVAVFEDAECVGGAVAGHRGHVCAWADLAARVP